MSLNEYKNTLLVRHLDTEIIHMRYMYMLFSKSLTISCVSVLSFNINGSLKKYLGKT